MEEGSKESMEAYKLGEVNDVLQRKTGRRRMGSPNHCRRSGGERRGTRSMCSTN